MIKVRINCKCYRNCVMGKCALRFFTGPCQSIFGCDPDYIKLYCVVFRDYIMQSVSYQKKNWPCPTCQSFFWYDNDEDLKAHFSMTWLKSESWQGITLSKGFCVCNHYYRLMNYTLQYWAQSMSIQSISRYWLTNCQLSSDTNCKQKRHVCSIATG